MCSYTILSSSQIAWIHSRTQLNTSLHQRESWESHRVAELYGAAMTGIVSQINPEAISEVVSGIIQESFAAHLLGLKK